MGVVVLNIEIMDTKTMNWNGIAEANPKAWANLFLYHDKLFTGSHDIGYIDHPSMWLNDGYELTSDELRHLYEFFNSHKIFLIIKPYDGIKWFYDFEYEENPDWMTRNTISLDDFSDSRQDAEIAGFTHLFEILDTQLTTSHKSIAQKRKRINHENLKS